MRIVTPTMPTTIWSAGETTTHAASSAIQAITPRPTHRCPRSATGIRRRAAAAANAGQTPRKKKSATPGHRQSWNHVPSR
jgi:hypothetical protein